MTLTAGLLLVACVVVTAGNSLEEPSTKLLERNRITTLEGHCEGKVCRDFHYDNVSEPAFFDLKAEVRITPDSTYDLSNPVQKDAIVFENSVFASFPLHLLYSVALRELDMRNCSVELLSWEAFLMADNLSILLLSHNRIHTIREMTFNYAAKLQYLFLDYNRLETLVSESFKGLAELRYLNMRHNRLRVLPEGLFDHLPALRELHLAENRLRVIGNELFVSNPLLQTVTLDRNRLRELDENAFKAQPYMVQLDISNNEHLEILVINVRTQYLMATNCSLYRVNIYGIAENVDMRDNQILELYFSQPETLESLNLRNNALQQIASLTLATNLSELDLSANPHLGILPEPWTANSLERLDLSNTTITHLPLPTIAELSKLRFLNVSNNKIREINPRNFKYLERLEHFHIHANDWNCYNLRLLMDLLILPRRIAYTPDKYDPEFPGEYINDIACMYRLDGEDTTADDSDNGSTTKAVKSEQLNADDAAVEIQKLRNELKAIVGFYEAKLDALFEKLRELNARMDKFEVLNSTFWDNVAITV